MNENKDENKEKSFNPFPKMEETVLDFWDKAKIFKKTVDKDAPKGDYVFYDGPPFGTGEPHYGHLLSSIAKDVVPRYQTMKGFRVERRWGWDCHGLPIENIIEKNLGISGRKQIEELGIAKFNEACRARVLEYADIWEKMIRRIGRWVEFKNSYKTMDATFMESVWWAFKELWNKDLVYEGHKVLLYCPRCETPISNFEVAMDNSYKDITETSVYVKFKLKTQNSKLKTDGDVYILAWTTTPWTLPGNVALAVKADIEYAKIKYEGLKVGNLSKNSYVIKKIEPGTYILAKDIFWNNLNSNAKLQEEIRLLVNYNDEMETDLVKFARNPEGFFKKYNIDVIKGRDLVGLEYEPLFDVPAMRESGKKAYYVADADFVTTEDGTGVVHTAVVYGEDDYNLGLKLDLPVVPALDEKGFFNETVPQFKGVYFKDADKKIIADLDKRGFLFAKEDIMHSYPHCWRCETQLFYNAIPALFLAISKIKKRMLALNEKINWFPAHLKYGRFALGIEQAPDWNISRNRYFATPIPIWKCDRCEEKRIVGSIKELEELSGRKSIDDIHSHFIDDVAWSCSNCDGKMRRVKEVFDCWVESGSMSFAQTHYPFENKEKFEKNFPAQYISEYISQTRAWFYVMHAMSTALFDSNSFENVVATGVILNEKGDKMSKSKKNFPDPKKVIDEFGADALRFYLMSSSLMQAENLFFNERELRDIFRKNIMILWNVYKFYEMYDDKSKVSVRGGSVSGGKSHKSKVETGNILDKWILLRLGELINEVTENMDKYDLVRASRPISDFINDLSTWYIRRSRDRFKGEDKKDNEAALQITGYVLIELSKVIAPFMPFIAEQIWQKVTGYDFKDENKSVHLEGWPKAEFGMRNAELGITEKMELVRKIVELGLAERDKAGVKVRQPLLKLKVKSKKLKVNGEFVKLIKDEVNVKDVEFMAEDDELGVELDTTISDDLKLEGMKRDLVRQINMMRKEAGLTIADRIELSWLSESKIIKDVFEKMGEEIKKDTLAEKINKSKEDEAKEVKINGEIALLNIKKL